MARLPRLTLPGHPHHLIQRGNDRNLIFSEAADYLFMLALFRENAPKFDVALHAYVLMPNHFHWLVTPHTERGLGQLMQSVGRRYVRYFNDLRGRTGTLWEGRYRSTVIQADRYTLDCMAYMDLNPVRAGLAADAGDHAWSSYRHFTGLRVDPFITPHPQVWTLGNTPFEREAAYAERVQQGIGANLQVALTESVLAGWALGDPKFLLQLQSRTARRVQKAQPGRPALRRLPNSA